jgi:hypothetical protein
MRKRYVKDMNSLSIRRSFVAILLMYCCVTATLPLSNIHVESMPSSYGFVCGQDHQKNDIQTRLHEILFSHFSNKSDHIRNISSFQQIKHKTGGNRDYLQFVVAADSANSTVCFGSHRISPWYDEYHAAQCPCFTVSGLSPPSA